MHALVKKKNGITFRNPGLSSRSQESYAIAVRGYKAYIRSKKKAEGIESIKEWLNKYKNANTYNLYLQAIKEFYLKLFENESAEKLLDMQKNFSKIHKKTPDSKITQEKYLTEEQIKKLVRKALRLGRKRSALIVEALFESGCRISELASIEAEAGESIPGYRAFSITGKGDKVGAVYLSTELYRKVKDTFQGKQFLFEEKGKPLNRVSVTQRIKRLAAACGFKASAHTMRHSKAMYCKDVMKLSPDQVQKALRHSSVVTTLQHYYHGTPSPEQQGIGRKVS